MKSEKIDYYIENREDSLKMVSQSRKKSKTEFLKTLYLGNLHLFREDYKEVDGDITESGKFFLQDLHIEIERLADMIWVKNPQFHKLKTGKEKKMICTKTNPKASLMSIIFQTEERKILLIWDSFLTRNHRYLGVFIHDGGYVEKLEGETKFPENLLVEGSKEILKVLGYNAKLTQKDITFTWEPKKPQKTQYDVKKLEFEEKQFLVGSDFFNIHDDGETSYMKERDMKL